jgi:anaerobic selenocysteine-containing dehydrogenase
MLVQIEDGRATKLQGDPDHPITRGFLCEKVTRYLDRVYHPERLLYPMKRTGAKGAGQFTRITWDEALATIAQKMQAATRDFGSESILPYSYSGTLGYVHGGGMDHRFFHRAGASRLDRTICATAGMFGSIEATGSRFSMEPEAFAHAKLIIAWGANILATNIHLWPFVLEARRNGAKFYVIDPVRTKTAALADHHFAIYPGSDLALALGLMHILFRDELEDNDYLAKHTNGEAALRQRASEYPPARVSQLTGLSEGEIEMLARDYGTTQAAAIRLNYGVQRSDRGGRAVRAIYTLPAVTGKWKYKGGGAQLSTSGGYQLNKQALTMAELQLKSPAGRETRLLNMVELGACLTKPLSPPVKVLYVYNANPAASTPALGAIREGLRREDLFTVVHDQLHTDTVDFADIVLPAATFLETQDLYFAYGHNYLQMAEPVLPPPGEAKANAEVFRLLAAKMGFDDPCFRDSDEDIIRQLLNSEHPFIKGITYEQLQREKRVRLQLGAEPGEFRPYAEGNFGTKDGKADLGAAVLDYVPPVESRLGAAFDGRYPLELVSAKSEIGLNSTFAYRDAVDQQAGELLMNVEDAAPRGIQDGDAVRVFNDRGSVLCRASVNGGVRTGVVKTPAIRWGRRSPDGNNVNLLISDRLTDIGAGATFFSCLVEVERCAAS